MELTLQAWDRIHTNSNSICAGIYINNSDDEYYITITTYLYDSVLINDKIDRCLSHYSLVSHSIHVYYKYI